MITLHNYPLQLAPSNSAHYWTVSSTLSGNTNFKYVFDIYVNKNGWERVARLKTRPNEQGYGIVDLEEITFNQLTPNPRSDQNQANGNTFEVLPQGIVSNTYGITLSNAYNGTTGYDDLYHISEYRVMLGEEYLSGSTTVIDIPTNASASTYSAQTITIFPGASDNKELFKKYYWNASRGTYGENLWKDTTVWDNNFNHSPISQTNQRRFLNTAGNEYTAVVQSDAELTGNTSYVRYRKHHPDCPIIVSWFNGGNGLFCNDSTNLAIYNFDGNSWIYEDDVPCVRYSFCPSTEPFSNRIQYYTYQPETNGEPFKMFFMADDANVYDYDTNGISEMLVFQYQDTTCFTDAAHILFLNKKGVWDTYSFGIKHIRSLKRSVQTYAQSPNYNKSLFNLFSYQQRNIVFDHSIDEMVEATTWYMDENDKSIIEELFLSPYTYLMDSHAGYYNGSGQYFPALIPIKINTDTWTEFKNQYTKLAQYSFTFTYNPITDFRLQG